MKRENLIDKVTEGLRKGIFIKNYSKYGDPIEYIPGNKIDLCSYKREIHFRFSCIEYISPILVKESGESWGLSETDLQGNHAEEVGEMKSTSKTDDERKGLMSQEYTQYIVEHKANVEKAFRWIIDHNIFENCEIPVNIISHDLSKYSAEEYKAYDDYFYGERTKEVEKAFNYAWLHHIHSNPHHWQYWVLKHDDGSEEALEMPLEYVVEMICDWWSFSFKTGNLYEIFDWYKKHKSMVLHKNTRKLVEDTLDKIKKALNEEEK